MFKTIFEGFLICIRFISSAAQLQIGMFACLFNLLKANSSIFIA